MTIIAGVEMRMPQNHSERWWFSYIAGKAESAKYGELELTLTIKGGKVVNIKNRTTENVNLHASVDNSKPC